MDSINGVPFRWDGEDDERLLGSLLTDFSSFSSTIPNSSAQNIFQNPLELLSGNQLSDYPWKTYWSNELGDLFFGGVKNKVSGPDDPIEVTDETDIFNSLEASRKAIFYTDNNRNKKFDKGDTYLFDIKIFISEDGAKLQRAWLGAPPKDNELLIFLENNKGDQVSGQRLFAKAGKNVAAQIEGYSDNLNIFEWINGIHTISKKDLRLLLVSAGKAGLFVRTLKKVLSATAKIVTWPIEKLADLFFWIGKKIQDNLRINDSTWNGELDAAKQIGEQQQKVKEVFKDLFKNWYYDDPDSLKSKTIPQYEKVIQEVLKGAMKLVTDYADKIPDIIFAVVCGVINGIVDLIASFFTFIGLVLKLVYTGIRETGDVIANLDYYTTLILEYQDNFIQAIRKIKWQEVIEQAYSAYINFMSVQLPFLLSQAVEHIAGIDVLKLAKEIGYYIGYIGINIVVCFIPVVDLIELTQISKLAKPIQQLLEVITKLVRKSGSFVAKNLSEVFSLLEGFIKMLEKGTDEVVNFVKGVFEAIKVWLEELVGLKKSVAEIPDLSVEELDWMASRKIGALGGKVLKQTQIRSLRGLLTKRNIQLIVDGDSKGITRLFIPTGGFRTAEDLFLFMKAKRPPYVGMFNAETKQFFLSKQATEIVVFHEMAHVKHFKEVGDAAYKTYTKLEKEMYVWKQIYSQKKRWTNDELKDALNYVNEIRTAPQYGYGLNPLNIKL